MSDLFQDDTEEFEGKTIVAGLSAPDHRMSIFLDDVSVKVVGSKIDVRVDDRILVVSRGASLTLEDVRNVGYLSSLCNDNWRPSFRVKMFISRLPIDIPLPFHRALLFGTIKDNAIRIDLPSMVIT